MVSSIVLSSFLLNIFSIPFEYTEYESRQIAHVVTNLARHFFINDPTDVTLLWTKLEDFTGLRSLFAQEFSNVNNKSPSRSRYDGPFALQVIF